MSYMTSAVYFLAWLQPRYSNTGSINLLVPFGCFYTRSALLLNILVPSTLEALKEK